MKSDSATVWLTALGKNNEYHRGVLKHYQQTAGSRNQISAADVDPNESAIDTRNEAIEIAEDDVDAGGVRAELWRFRFLSKKRLMCNNENNKNKNCV